MAGTIPPSPSLGELQLAIRSGDTRAQQAAMDINPPNEVDPQDVATVREAAERAREPDPRNIVDITV